MTHIIKANLKAKTLQDQIKFSALEKIYPSTCLKGLLTKNSK